ncbi:hypothetical protein [Fulvivirga lutea]|uniref:DUF4270 family protein n=1 Tax=Fulvivirga lutea TaxID=2810512 RepID=A0A975A2J5_9BACT|nr:hypothetical protein [Fulvivirga lutea]QSE98607.1 hypothetical protein JR347_05880 [Fulvivirga lutea]
MNLWDKKLGLFLIAALTFFACDEEVGQLNITPENNLGIFFAEQSVADDIEQLWVGSSPSSFQGRLFAGHYVDPNFGNIDATGYCDISIGSVRTDPFLISSAEYVDLALNLRIREATGTYTSIDIQKFELFQLAEPINDEEALTSSTVLDLGEKIGDIEFALYPDSINLEIPENVSEEDRLLYDANGIYIYTINFSLSEEFKQEFFDAFITSTVDAVEVLSIDSSGAVNDTTFTINSTTRANLLDQKLKGLAIVPSQENTAVIGFDLLDPNTNFDLDYTVENVLGSRIDENGIFVLNSLKSFTNFSPNEDNPWSGGIFDGVSETGELFPSNDDQVYFQAGTNMYFSVDVSEFRDLRDSIPNIIIQRAVLSIENLINPQARIDNPTSLSFLMTNDEELSEGILSNNADGTLLSDLPNLINFNSDSEAYNVEIPLYLQGIVDNENPYDKIIVGLNTLARDLSVRSFVVKKEDIKIKYYYSVTN